MFFSLVPTFGSAIAPAEALFFTLFASLIIITSQFCSFFLQGPSHNLIFSMQCDVLRMQCDFCQRDGILSRNNSETGVKNNPRISSIRAQRDRQPHDQKSSLTPFYFFFLHSQQWKNRKLIQKEPKGVRVRGETTRLWNNGNYGKLVA